MNNATNRSIRWAQAGLLTNAVLVLVKFIAGIVGHANALVADAVESSADIFSSVRRHSKKLQTWRRTARSSKAAAALKFVRFNPSILDR